MPTIVTRVCGFCGFSIETYKGPVDPRGNPNEEPPGTGWHQHAGPSWGLGFPETDFYCSDECLNRRVILKEEPIREVFEFEKSWQHPIKDFNPRANKNRQG